ncbi:MAG: anaerobic ribonucleoside-triphosphate reductase activating protein [Bacteroidales bacterium]|nr:anaerobic ribonucleoside-triphosphate reductase activating protein [Bacteroidales bacterium]MBQ6100824.1 anaerobic ribonucleoside-triphosphate reductase activating protein [Bacteroidales bacterium]
MLKYANFDIVFQEVPDEVTLAINISNCPNQCVGCHSQYLWKDVGYVLDKESLDELVEKYQSGITCVCFMGGDAEPYDVANLAMHIKNKYKDMKTAWYSGKNELPDAFHAETFDYIKTGRYEAALGALDSRTTNQRMIKRLADGRVKDITSRFQKQVQEEKAATL